MHHCRLPELSFGAFAALVPPLLRDGAGNNVGWLHFEGRNVDEYKQMMALARGGDGGQSITISVEIEKVRRGPALLELLPYADVVFIAREWAEPNGYASAEEALRGVGGLRW